MVFEAIFDALFGVLNWLVYWLPAFDMAFLQIESILTIFELVYKSSFFVPWSTFFMCIGIISSYYTAKTAANVIQMIIDYLPFT